MQTTSIDIRLKWKVDHKETKKICKTGPTLFKEYLEFVEQTIVCLALQDDLTIADEMITQVSMLCAKILKIHNNNLL